jgi:hypothetical protein
MKLISQLLAASSLPVVCYVSIDRQQYITKRLTSNHGLGVEEATEGTRANLINDIGLEIDIERTRDVLARRGLREEGGEAIILGSAVLKTTIGLKVVPSGEFVNVWLHAKDTHVQTVLNGVELPYEQYTLLARPKRKEWSWNLK